MPKVIKPSNPFTNVCWFCFNNISAPPQILAASTVSSAQFRNEEMMGDGFLWCYCCRFVLNSKRLLSTSCNKQGQRSSEQHFSWCYSRCFLKLQNRMCKKIKQTLNNELKFHIVNIY